jgi:hypothetical protein
MPDDGDKGEALICTGPVGRVLHASMASDKSMMNPTYRYVSGTHTFYKLRLAKGPIELVKAAREAAEEEIANAYSKLMHLNYRDTGYGDLKELYGKAVAEMFEGRNAFNRAVLAEGIGEEHEQGVNGEREDEDSGEHADDDRDARKGGDEKARTSGNRSEALTYYARAASLYARAQAHAREVTEALVPAPTSPSDLGLRPFGGSWAKWETKVSRAR